MKHVECVVVGGGPAGLNATKSLLESGVSVLLIDRATSLGGQLIKQTHKFFGSQKQHAKVRGFDIAKLLINNIKDHPLCEIWTNTTVVALYPQNIITTYDNHVYQEIKAEKIILATGASEKSLAFENNDLPQVMGAGAIQTLMNVHGVLPAKEVVMIGSGNIGLIVSYQLLQANIKVKAVIEASNKIGGYAVHASKLVRHNVPIYTRKTIKKAIGVEHVEAVEIVSVDDHFNEIENTSEIIPCDTVCIAVGLSPLHQLASMINVKTKYIPQLGGVVAIVNEKFQTSHPDVYIVGDALGIEEASSAMMEGACCGLHVANSLHKKHPQHDELLIDYHDQLKQLRSGPYGKHTLAGLEMMQKEASNVR